MRSRKGVVMVAVGGMLAGSAACRDRPRAGAKGAAVKADEVTAPSARPVSWPAGPLVAERAAYAMALYFPKTTAASPEQAIAACARKAPTLRLVAVDDDVEEILGYGVRRIPLADFAPPTVAELPYMGVGVSPAQGESLQASADPLVVTFVGPGPQAPALLDAATALMDCAARRLDALVWDEESRRVFSREAWQDRLGPPTPDRLSRHFVIHSYENDGAVRAVSLGLGKLGLPDLVVERTTRHSASRVVELMNEIASELFRRGSLTDAGQLRLTPRPGAGGAAAVAIELVEGTRAPGDNENRLIEVWFGGADSGEHARQVVVLNKILGEADDQIIRAANDDRELLAARDRARAALPGVRERYNRGEFELESVSVKALFEDEHGSEWMWVEVRSWRGDRIEGVLTSTPFDVRTVVAGDHVTVSMDGVFDYEVLGPDGVVEGGETSRILEGRAR